jgi:hypothetical protein
LPKRYGYHTILRNTTDIEARSDGEVTIARSSKIPLSILKKIRRGLGDDDEGAALNRLAKRSPVVAAIVAHLARQVRVGRRFPNGGDDLLDGAP